MRALILCLALCFSVLISGCQTSHPFATPDASWKSHVGQLKFSNRKRTVIGEVVVQQRGTTEFQLDFLKGGGIALMSVRGDADKTRAEGLLARGSWQGSPATAPKALRPWLTLRDAFLQHKPARSGDHSWEGRGTYSGGELRGLSVAFPEDNTRFEFQFSR